jgi:GNAT superfamily N-acetyltransferase
MAQVRYEHLRALELEGRHPHDVGYWLLTLRRLEAGEGVPLPFDADYQVEVAENAPLPPAPRLPADRRKRTFYYRRVRGSAEAQHLIQSARIMVPVSLWIHSGWSTPAGGVIPMPTEGEPLLERTHLVTLGTTDPQRRHFAFRNTWGEEWGRQGCGFLPHGYVDRYAFESWVAYPAVKVEWSRVTRQPGAREGRWTVRDEWNRKVYGFEIWDDAGKERRAWAFVLEHDGGLEVEELYVRPEFRRQGLGRTLASRVRELAQARSLPLRVWIPFADSRQESPDTAETLPALARRLGVQFQPCPVPWAAYAATSDQAGETNPIEPRTIPGRPGAGIRSLPLSS